MPLIIQSEWYTEKQIKENRNIWFVFGDNEARQGMGGQARFCRGEPNTIGIRTKRAPLTDPSVYWTDKTLQSNCRMVYQDFEVVISKLIKGDTVVFPADGFGTGLAELESRAPHTLKFIKYMYHYCQSIYEVDKPKV